MTVLWYSMYDQRLLVCLIQYVFIQHFDGVYIQILLSINLDNCPAEKIQTDNRSWHVSSPVYTLGISNEIKMC